MYVPTFPVSSEGRGSEGEGESGEGEVDVDVTTHDGVGGQGEEARVYCGAQGVLGKGRGGAGVEREKMIRKREVMVGYWASPSETDRPPEMFKMKITFEMKMQHTVHVSYPPKYV